MALYEVVLVILGLSALLAAIVPILLKEHHPSFPLLFVALGFAAGSLSLPVGIPNPLQAGQAAERLTELGVILALAAVGLKIDRPLGVRRWALTWRLLVVTMPLTILGVAFLGWWFLALAPAAAVLFGACISPTDPVLASDIQVGPPGSPAKDDDIRFALTSEAGLNDGLAFPYTYAAVHVLTATALLGPWIGEWALVDVVYRISAGTLVGWATGWLLARLIFRTVPGGERGADSLLALAITFTAYGLAELAAGYGFIAVFVAARAIRNYERDHGYHQEMHDVADQAERFVASVILLLFGATVAQGLLAPLTWPMALVGLAVLLVVRPVAGMVGLAGSQTAARERAVISFYGIRGIATFYYLSYALNEADFPDAERLWALAGFVVLASVVLHGATAGWTLRRLTDRD